MKTTIIALFALLSAPQFVAGQDACDDLKTRVYDVVQDGDCDCVEADGNLEFTCTISDACLTSGGGDPYSGELTASVLLEGVDSPSYSQRLTVEICFDYDDDLYNGTKACHRSFSDGLGTLFDCLIEVDDQKCTECQFCANRDENLKLLSGFDCSNVGGEVARECASDNANAGDTIMRFLYAPETSKKCPKSSSSSSSGSSTSSTSAPGVSPGAGPSSAFGLSCYVVFQVLAYAGILWAL